MAADDLLRLVALDPFRAFVPGGDVAVRIEHENRVIANRGDEQLEDLSALPKLLFGMAARGHVTRDLRESGHRPLVVAQRCDDGVRPEALTVFADAPPFIFDAAFARCGFELAPRLFRGKVFRTVENGEMLADGLLFLVAHDPRGAAIPRANDALGIEQEDGVILDRIDENGEFFRPRSGAVFVGAC